MILFITLFILSFLSGFFVSKRWFEGRFKRAIERAAALHTIALAQARNDGVWDGIRKEQIAQASREKKAARQTKAEAV